MTKKDLLSTSRLNCVAFIALSAAAATPAFAQTASDQDPSSTLRSEVEIESAQDSASADPIIVTGSRIRRPNLDSNIPITSVGPEELSTTGNLSLGDTLNELPSLRATVGEASAAKGVGTTGLNILDLRGLGPPRTLVLVNGRRHITSQPGDFYVDVGTIPPDLVERVDVVTGGNSAVYGSDAIAGVVNFILKRNFEGLRFTGRSGISERGNRGSYAAGLTAGKNFAQGRGNIALSLQFTQQNALQYLDRDDISGAYSGRNQYQLSDITSGETQAGDGIPDNLIQTGIRSAVRSNGGMILGSFIPNSTSIRRNFAFDRTGSLQESVCEFDFRIYNSGNCKGGLGTSQREYGQFLPEVKRYFANLLGHFDVTDSLRFFFEGKYVHSDAVQAYDPFIIQSGDQATFNINNPFLTDQARATILKERPGTTTFAMQRTINDLGRRGEYIDRDTFRLVAGLEGDFNDDWRYEVAVNYGVLRTDHLLPNNVVISRFMNAKDAVRNAQGQIVCGINADATTANDDPACAPLDLFGEGRSSQAARDYVLTDSTRQQKATEFVASAYISGDSSQLFELPGGPISFAFGGEYRRETASSDWDSLVETGATSLFTIPDFNPPAFTVKEVYGEVILPILKDQPFAHELSISAAARLSDYSGSTGTVWAYNAGGVYAPIRDLRFRANYARSVRAPTPNDLYSSNVISLTLLSDPCDVINLPSGPNRVKNCAALGVPADFVNSVSRFQAVPYTSGGFPGLHEETSDSYTAGFVLTPTTVLPGFSLSADYYDIKVKGLIARLGASAVLATCYDAASVVDNPYCARISRLPSGFFDPASAVLDAPFNFAAQQTTGIDVDVAYRHDFSGVRLDLRGIGSYIIRRDNYLNPLDPTFRDRVKGETGHPAFEGMFRAGLDFGEFKLGYELRYIGKQTIAAWEAQHSIDGRPATNADQFDPPFSPEVFYHDINFGFDVGRNFEFYGGVDNLLDRNPPLTRLGDSNGEPYDTVGRFFYIGVKADF